MNEDLFDGSLEIDPTLDSDQSFSRLAALPACKGVVFFADSRHRPVQLLIAANIRRTARARLHTEDSAVTSKRPEIASIVRYIFYTCSYNDFKAALSHYTLAKNIWPDIYPEMLSVPKLSLVKISPSAKWPTFSVVSSTAQSNDEVIFGPFQTRKSATEFVNALENAFSLCHRPDLAANVEKAASCPYLQMDKCPAPCIGKITRQDYQLQIENAITAASACRSQLISDLQDKMKSFSAEMEFEQANHTKNQFQQLARLDKYSYKWTARLKELTVLHINISAKVKTKGQRKKTQTFAAFLIRGTAIYEFEPFTLDNIEQFRELLSNELAVECVMPDRKTSAEQLAIVCSFLYRRKPAGIWINCSTATGAGIPAATKLENMINRFMEEKPKRILHS
jgi:excinuclease UvrABC nuclease subunit